MAMPRVLRPRRIEGGAPIPEADVSDRAATTAVISASVAMGLVPIFARELTDAGIAPVGVSFHRNLLGCVLLIGFLRPDHMKRGAIGWGLLAGFGMGLGWASYVRAVEVVAVSTAGVVYMSYPLFTVVLAWLIFRHRPHSRAVGGGLLVLVAAVIALGPELDGAHLDTLVVSIAAPLSFGFAVVVLTERLGSLTSLERVAVVALGSTVGLLPIVASLPSDEVIPSSPRVWALTVGVALFTAIGPQWLYVRNAPHVGAARAAIAGSVELPTMFIVGSLVFGERLGPSQLVAGALVVVAVLTVPSRPSPATAVVRRRSRLRPGRFYDT